jgi:signal transduction histidine kinase
MTTRRRLTWIVFAVCAVLVLEGLGWVTWQALSARADAQFQESLRLALWRMDSELTPVLAQEAARPYFQYRAFYPAERAYTRMWQEIQPGELRVPSPLLEGSGPFIRLHFEVEPDGSLTSPQAPTGNMRDLAESAYIPGEYIVYAGELLDRLAALLRASEARVDRAYQHSDEGQSAFGIGQPGAAGGAPPPQDPGVVGKSAQEFAARQQVAQQALIQNDAPRRGRETISTLEERDRSAGSFPPAEALAALRKLVSDHKDAPRSEPGDALEPGPQTAGAAIAPSQPVKLGGDEIRVGPFEPEWLPGNGSPELVLRRTVHVGGTATIQGVWLDWPAVHARLLEVSHDLLPGAELEPVRPGQSAPAARMLASIPVLLVPGSGPTPWAPGLDAATATLALTWLAVLGAVLAIGVVLRASMELSDRRGRFVSAVTHELRTPLTTFRLYSEMLADGLVKDDGTKREYLATLRDESRHLAGIVENVLDYARLGQGPRSTQIEPIDASKLMDLVRPTLTRRAEQCGMTLVPEPVDLSGVRVAADPRTVERILLNLVDNACKYAGKSADKRIHLRADVAPEVLHVHVRDHGPGIQRTEQSRVFEAFHRAPRDANGPQSGLGLGLALARGLAREMHGELEIVPAQDGAELRLTLPRTSDPATPQTH